MAKRKHRWSIGNLIAPPRFILFAVVFAAIVYVATPQLGIRHGVMVAFDSSALLFFLFCLPLLGHESERMRISACRNDANRAVLLLLTVAVSFVILTAIATELMQRDTKHPWTLVLIIGTLALSWLFTNFIYALHYAHLFCSDRAGGDAKGIEFPGTAEPDYFDFLYFAVCLGMTFQTSDVTITDGKIRQVVTLHCLAAFVFNLGVLGFTINVLGGSS